MSNVVILLLGICPREMKTKVYTKSHTEMLKKITKMVNKRKQLNYQLTDE
jgi:hypothetical protein